MNQNETLDELRTALADRGLNDALAKLNSQTACRYTAMYRFDSEMLRNQVFFDRTIGLTDAPDDIPIEASYCVYVRDTNRPFSFSDSLNDMRVENHPKKTEIRAYCGVPMVDANGFTVGTLCHFDVDPVAFSDEHVQLMEDFGKLVTRYGLPK